MTPGDWIRRPPKGGRGFASDPKWHLVESVIASDAVTRCGRRLRKDPDHELEVSEVMPLTRMIGQPQLCRAGCQRSNEEAA